MSDNPDVLTLGVEPDEEGFQQLDQAVSRAGDSFDALGGKVEDLSDVAGAAIDQVVAKFNTLPDAAKDAADQTSTIINQMRADIFSAEQDLSPDGGGGGGRGGLFGVSRAFSAGGALARQAGAPELGTGLQVSGELLRTEQGLQRIGDLLPRLNEGLEASGGLFPEITTALVAAEVPLAGLVGTLGPLAVVAGVAAVAFVDLKEKMDQGAGAVQQAITNQDKLTATLEKGQDSQQLRADLTTQTDTRSDLQTRIDATVNTINEGYKQAADQGLLALGEYLGSSGKAELDKSLASLRTQLGNTQAAIDADTSALNNAQTAAIDSAEATRKRTDAEIAQAKQFAADDQLSLQAAQARVIANNADIQSRLQANSAIADEDKNTALSAQQHLLNAQAIQSNIDVIVQDIAETDHLTQTSIPLIEARKQEADAATALKTAIEDGAKAALDYGKTFKDINTQLAQDEQQYTQGSLQDVQQRSQIRLKESRDETALTLQTADAVKDILTKRDEKEVQDNIDLARQLSDDQVKADDQKAQDIRQTQAIAETDAQSHEQRLKDIKTQAQDNEFSDLLNRNFLALALDQRKKQTDISTEDQHYAQQQQDLQKHLSQQEQEQQIALNQLEAQQVKANARKIDDQDAAADDEITQQHVNEDRKRVALRLSEDQQLQDLTANERYYIQILESAAKARIQLAFDTETAIVAASISAFNKAITSFLYPSSGNSGGSQLLQLFTNYNGKTVPANTIIGAAGQDLESVLRGFFG